MQRKIAVITDVSDLVFSKREAEVKAMVYLKEYPDLKYFVVGGAIGNQIGIFNVNLEDRKITTEFKPEAGLTVDSILKNKGGEK